jgi:hypothetical protein
MMRIAVDAPRWARFRLLRWGARWLGMSRRWEASGRLECDLMTDLTRLGEELGFTVIFNDRGTFSLVWQDDGQHVVEAGR